MGSTLGAPMLGNRESEDMGKVENQMEKTWKNEMGTTTYRVIWGLFWEQCRIKWKMVYNRGYAPYISNPLTQGTVPQSSKRATLKGPRLKLIRA